MAFVANLSVGTLIFLAGFITGSAYVANRANKAFDEACEKLKDELSKIEQMAEEQHD